MDTNENIENPDTTPEDNDVEGHRIKRGGALDGPDNDDVEGHRIKPAGALDGPDDDVEGHLIKPAKG